MYIKYTANDNNIHSLIFRVELDNDIIYGTIKGF